MFFTTELIGTIGYLSPTVAFPEGLIEFAEVIAATTSSGVRL